VEHYPKMVDIEKFLHAMSKSKVLSTYLMCTHHQFIHCVSSFVYNIMGVMQWLFRSVCNNWDLFSVVVTLFNYYYYTTSVQQLFFQDNVGKSAPER